MRENPVLAVLFVDIQIIILIKIFEVQKKIIELMFSLQQDAKDGLEFMFLSGRLFLFPAENQFK
ncbi:hypothetical protein [Chryseobacterium sp. Leaf201]|uniref:hypothetical protein n=1 Tax=Chryseobacterium sp. Leaf201 TaxID=1735672 RepID=UPI0006FA11BE|nr:hypothetical protein [Chryseobacterium sp. Leaf201]KQM50282.1 hypothetical protein ASE55_08575 [Chryseobacterium sp. Leaf201]